MRVLVVHHGPLPQPGSPTTGGALRADWHRRALCRLGHDVVTLHRDQDGAGGFTGPAHLRALAAEVRPDWTLCVAPEEAPGLQGVAPLVVDLYAPRLLEAAFAGQQEDAAQRALLAIDAADDVLFSNAQQRLFWMGVLGLAGWDLSRPTGTVVPLVADAEAITPAPDRPGAPRVTTSRGRAAKSASTGELPVVIAGGYPWPWQDASDALRRATRHLAGRARVVSYGLPAIDGVEAHGIVPRGDWLAACRDATVAIDRYARHQERELAVSFRQMDYLAAGLPTISDPWTPLADSLRRFKAGEVDLPLEDALDQALTHPDAAKGGIDTLRQMHSLEAASNALHDLQPCARVRTWSVVRWSRDAANAIVNAQADRRLRESAEAEVQVKRAEVAALVEQSRALSDAVARLSSAMADVAGFRRETVAVLGTRLAGQTDEAEHLRRELAIAQGDLTKKQAELERMTTERDRMGGILSRLARR